MLPIGIPPSYQNSCITCLEISGDLPNVTLRIFHRSVCIAILSWRNPDVKYEIVKVRNILYSIRKPVVDFELAKPLPCNATLSAYPSAAHIQKLRLPMQSQRNRIRRHKDAVPLEEINHQSIPKHHPAPIYAEQCVKAATSCLESGKICIKKSRCKVNFILYIGIMSFTIILLLVR